jgi:hypothetical protein
MTIFEKIYWTSWIVSVLSWFLGNWLEDEFLEYDFTDFLKCLIGLDVFFTIGYWIVKLVLWIWGIHICLFPSLVRAFTR